MKKLIITGLLLIISKTAFEQGCVIVRNISGFAHYNFNDKGFSTSEWILDFTSRYFKSFRDFKGSDDQKTPEAERSINKIFTLDITATRLLKNGWSLSFNLPFTANDRSSTSEHASINGPRHSTQSFGIGDIRFTAYKWLIKPAVRQKTNVQIGLGLKFPTGNFKYEDYFYRKEDSLVLAPVNPSIQLGDGGTGIITEFNAYHILSYKYSLYANLYYMVNPRDINGTSSKLGRPATALDLKTMGNVNSSPDQYTARTGVNISFKKFIASAGFRIEGIPVYDLIGGSNGNRRAGYNMSFEPGVIYNFEKTSVILYVPVMVKRGTKQSVPDKLATEYTGNYILQQGGFADYLVFVGASFKL